MVYLTLSANDIDESLKYYSKNIGVFSAQYHRLICDVGTELMIDLVQVGTEEHLVAFEQNEATKASFTICSTNSSIELIKHLKQRGVEYTERGTVVGLFLEFKDPTGNYFSIFFDNDVLMKNA